MKKLKKAISFVLIFAMLSAAFPNWVFAAEEESFYSIENDYLSFSFNKKTGGFAVETLEGNPRKVLDDYIPLLYAEDEGRSNGTSFITVRIDGEDYIFGQDYGFFGIASHLGTVAVKEEGRLIEIPWTIKDVTVTLKAALDNNEESNTTGNVGFSFVVQNNSRKEKEVSIRLLLDTALGSRVDAPYFVVGTDAAPTFTETEFSGDKVPEQIRAVDSVSKPTMLSYILTQADGWNSGVKPSKVILGHWANLANTRYDYSTDPYCDFSNYSNDYREPDSAAAIYWEDHTLAAGDEKTMELLYGVGNFSTQGTDGVGINILTDSVSLASDKKSYENDGKIKVTVTIDNALDDSGELIDAVVIFGYDEDKFKLVSGEDRQEYAKIGPEGKVLTYELQAKPQTELTAGSIYVSVTADGFETAAERSLFLPSVSGKADVQMNNVSPAIVYTDGEKAITVSGKMSELKAAVASNSNASLKLVHKTTEKEVSIKKKDIAFIDENCEVLTFTTMEPLTVGEYEIVFDFTNDAALKEQFGADSIKCEKTLTVSANKKYQLKSYGLVALVRTTLDGKTDYDFFPFDTESEFLKFYQGKSSATGQINDTEISHYNFGEDENAIHKHEILLTVRGKLNKMEEKHGDNVDIFWQASYENGDIIINNMLSYEGDTPLKLYKDGDNYIVEGDGLIKVINSINVWRSKWSISATKGIIYTLDEERFAGGQLNDVATNSLQLSLDGAASMIQSIGGFAIDLKYGVLSSEWYDDSDGMVTYGIGFGGSISLPINAKEEKTLTDDQEDIADAMVNLFDEGDDDLTGTSKLDKASTGDKLKKDTKLSEGQLSAEVNNVLFGEKGEVKNKKVEVEGTGFIGIDSTFSIALPQDVLGSLVSNAPGIYASVTINTIENQYEINAGLSIKIIECEGVLAFKQVKVTGKDVIVPDKIEFYIRDGLKIPIAPPALYIAGLGGGINELADTIGGNFDKLPPITILLYTRLEAIGVMIGDFNAKVSLEGLSLTGDMKLKAEGLEKVMDLKAGISARWVEPWQLSLYGNVSIIDGLIKGGITVTIADDYFYGYVYASLCIPDSIPFVGGKELRGVEAAVSNQFIGANIKLIGIKLGVIYYWGENVSFGTNIDLSPPNPDGEDGAMALDLGNENAVGYYGTNVHMLSAATLSSVGAGNETKLNVENAADESALLIELEYTGETPDISEITLKNPKDTEIILTADDGMGGGNFLLQEREGRKYIYITVTDSDLIGNGGWTVTCTNTKTQISAFGMNGVDDIASLDENGTTITQVSDMKIKVDSKVSGADGTSTATLDVYLTEDKDILKKIQTSKNTGDTLGTSIYHNDSVVLKDTVSTGEISLPDAIENGTYYAVAVLSSSEGISLAISKVKNEEGKYEPKAVKINNPNLPREVNGVTISYGGNGEIFVRVTDSKNADYTHYLAEIVPDNPNEVLENNLGQFEKGKTFVFGAEAGMKAGNSYHVEVKTLREEYKLSGVDEENKSDEGTSGEGTSSEGTSSEESNVLKSSSSEYKKHYYYGSGNVSSNSLTLPQTKLPNLKSVNVNFDTSGDEIITNNKTVIIDYTFGKEEGANAVNETGEEGENAYDENDVFVELSLNGSKVYALGTNPEAEGFSHFRKDWRFVFDDLEDGDYVVDFTAYTKTKDRIKGSETGVKNAYFAFTVDTSAPILSLAQSTGKNGDMTVAFGANTAIADENGEYTIRGITEKTAELYLDGVKIDENTEGVTLSSGGSFEITLKLKDDELEKQHILRATDKAGNSSELTVYAVRGGGFSFKELELFVNGEKAEADDDGLKRVIVKNGEKLNLTAKVVKDDGTSFNPDASDIIWSVLYAKNTIALENGVATALALGETAVTAKLATFGATQSSEERTVGLSDCVVIEVAANSKADLADKITEARTALENGTDKSQSKKDALKEAINEATLVLNGSDKTEEDYTKAVTKLNTAIDKFNSKSSSSGGGSRLKFDITAEKTEHGRVELSQKSVYNGNSVTITAIADEGYAVSDILINGESVGRHTVYTIAEVRRNTVVKVIFAEKSTIPFAFDDVSESDWFYENVRYAYENGLMLGTSETLFSPNMAVTRGMFVTVLYRLGSGEYSAKHGFTDVSNEMYYAEAIAWAAENGIVMGMTETEFMPDNSITREQMAAIILRYAKYRGFDVSVGEDTNILSYDDAEDISEYAIEAIQYAVGSGLIKGRTEKTLNPKDETTRAEVAAVLQRFIESNK